MDRTDPAGHRDDPAVVCDLGGLVETDLDVVDLLARLHLAARRAGTRLRLERVGKDVRELLELAGLDGVLLAPEAPSGELERQPEEREEAGVQEDVEVHDPPL